MSNRDREIEGLLRIAKETLLTLEKVAVRLNEQDARLKILEGK